MSGYESAKACIEQSYFAFGEEALALRLKSELVDLRAGHSKWS